MRSFKLLCRSSLLVLVCVLTQSCASHRNAANVELPSGRGNIGKRPTLTGLKGTLNIKEPTPISLSKNATVGVMFTVRNASRRPINLKFVTSQRIEILFRDPSDNQVLGQWSANQFFNPNGSYLIVNPQERVEFDEHISTARLKPNHKYNVEAYFVGYAEDFRVVKSITTKP